MYILLKLILGYIFSFPSLLLYSHPRWQEYDETMDHLQSDIESLETEKGELREKLKALNKKTLYDALSKSSPLTGKLHWAGWCGIIDWEEFSD